MVNLDLVYLKQDVSHLLGNFYASLSYLRRWNSPAAIVEDQKAYEHIMFIDYEFTEQRRKQRHNRKILNRQESVQNCTLLQNK